MELERKTEPNQKHATATAKAPARTALRMRPPRGSSGMPARTDRATPILRIAIRNGRIQGEIMPYAYRMGVWR